jgi:hypothetical protein
MLGRRARFSGGRTCPRDRDRFIIREHAGRFESSLVYRLPDLLAAPLDEPVYWTEGEKDVEALRAHGLLAVSTSDEPVPYDPRKVVRWCENRQVVLVPDNDAGQLYAAKIEASLRGDSIQHHPASGARPCQGCKRVAVSDLTRRSVMWGARAGD